SFEEKPAIPAVTVGLLFGGVAVAAKMAVGGHQERVKPRKEAAGSGGGSTERAGVRTGAGGAEGGGVPSRWRRTLSRERRSRTRCERSGSEASGPVPRWSPATRVRAREAGLLKTSRVSSKWSGSRTGSSTAGARPSGPGGVGRVSRRET